MGFQPSAFFQPPERPSVRARMAVVRRYLPRLPPSPPSPETETAWARAKRDTGRIKGTWLFRGAVVVVEVATLITVEELLVSATRPGFKVGVLTLFVVAVPFTVLGCVYAFQAWRAPFRQRRDWRSTIMRQTKASAATMLERHALKEQLALANTSREQEVERTNQAQAQIAALNEELAELKARHFPAGLIAVEPYFYIDLSLEPGAKRPARALVFKARVTNRERTRHMNLTFDLAFVWIRKPDKEEYRTRLYMTHQRFGKNYESDLLPATLDVGDNRTREGYLSFDWDFWSDRREFIRFINDIEDSGTFEAGEDGRFVLTIHDYISGESLELDVPGQWSSG